ncbi:MAG: cytochrome C [Ignavibacteriales bacterium]|jgi:c(7)-type cytochrome triheme protein|nr:cytochrome C [Ignavibacteriales bacterium]MBK7981321.1 cytochrome C [Ignavibacteriota bacterium]
MKIKHVYSLIGLATILYFGFTNLETSKLQTNRNQTLIKFSHKAHNEIAVCSDCHNTAAESTSLGVSLLPKMENCSQCHDIKDEDNCEQCHYKDVYEELIPRSSELIFNHKFHIEKNKMACADCHSGIMEVDYSFESANAFPSMKQCNTCHNDVSVASNNCEQCHISTVNLMPEDHKKVGFFKNHKFNNDNCEMCHNKETFCEDCHVSTTGIVESNTGKDFYTPYSPHNYIDGTKQQVITRVHDLNFVYTHGIEAKGKSQNCQTCHQTETFCAECHNSENGDFSLGGVAPLSHTDANFVLGRTIGMGGNHAILARRDIESCQSCHDVQGADPSCIMCHTDLTPGKGNDAKTHPSGFMRDVHGDWHNDGASICFDCHSSTNTAGVGFCGYCHGANGD